MNAVLIFALVFPIVKYVSNQCETSSVEGEYYLFDIYGNSCTTHSSTYLYLEIKNPKDVNQIEVDEENDEESDVIIYKSEQLLLSSRTILKLSWSRLPEWMRPVFRAYTHWQIHAHFVERNLSYTFELRRSDGSLEI